MAKNDGELFIYAVIGFFAGLFIFYKGFKNLRKKQLVENTPTSKIRSLAMGQVEVYGEALKANELLQSPFTNSNCFYYKYIVEELRRSKRSTYWATIAQKSKSIPFYLKDDTGQVLVDLTNAEVDIPQDFQSATATSQITSFLKTQNINSTGFLGFGRTLRFTEYYLAPKDKIYILGYAGKNPFSKGEVVKNEDGIMIQKGGEVYYVSDQPEKKVLDGLNWKSWGYIAGGALLTIVCLGIILKFLQVL